MMKKVMLTGLLIVVVSVGCVDALEIRENSLGMKLVKIPAGQFQMGTLDASDGDFDERPVQRVRISRPFWMSATEVTNAEYERFDPNHRKLRGRHGLSQDDDEAVIFVSWHDAVAFCEWLSEKEGKIYRLPTEAEWEYACRAGTTTAYHTGEILPEVFRKNQKAVWSAEPVPLAVGKTPPNAWGLYDMHGNVEEWCHDWYGPYGDGAQADPVGCVNGDCRVTRGGSHSTTLKYLRSANRMGTLPQDKHWLIGFRVVLGEMPTTKPIPAEPLPVWAQNVRHGRCDWLLRSDPDEPFFREPIPFQKVPPDSEGPMFSKHNHCPALAWCDNGDLLAVWFSCRSEAGREMTILGSRLRRGDEEWTLPAEFFNAPDRNMTGSALLNDGRGKLYFLNGLGASHGWQVNLALALRTSRDDGVSWSPTVLANPRRNDPEALNQPIASIFRLGDGTIVLPADAPLRNRSGGTALWMSGDDGRTWEISKGTIAGIHAGVVELADGRLLALGRSLRDTGLGKKLPQSISRDRGGTWAYSDSPFPAIGGGQRLVLRRLREGPILLVSFTDSSRIKPAERRGLSFKDAEIGEFVGYGLFAALSFDEGATWSVCRLLTLGGSSRMLNGGAWTRDFVMDATHAEPAGYLAATQTPDGTIHLISSRLHYRFNLAWLRQGQEE